MRCFSSSWLIGYDLLCRIFRSASSELDIGHSGVCLARVGCYLAGDSPVLLAFAACSAAFSRHLAASSRSPTPVNASATAE